MEITNRDGAWFIQAQTYALSFSADRPFVNVYDARGDKILELFALSSVQPLRGRDDTVSVGAWTFNEADGEAVFSLAAQSSAWRGKTYRFRCGPRRFRYEVTVEGAGELAEVNYFGGYSSARVRWGSGFFYSGQQFTRGFTPEPNAAEAAYFQPGGAATIDLMGVPLPGRDDWFFTPPPFCFAFELPTVCDATIAAEPAWLALGVEAAPGRNRQTRFTYHGQRNAFHLSLDFEGYTSVAGSYELPAISFDFAGGEWSALDRHLSASNTASREPRDTPPAWWREPIFCGWGSQCHVARQQGISAPACARQELYEDFLAALAANGVRPGTVVIDDKWQARYGENDVDPEKWPDLRGFVDARHAAGQRVLLWLKAWDPEGVPAAECIRNAGGLPVAVDPTNPAFVARLRNSVRRMLGAEGYNADGFKVDFSARIPSGPGMEKYGDAWGLELMRCYLEALYREAKQVKPQALVIAHTPHPYIAEVVDMVRLNDINTGQPVLEAMTRRARVARLACPNALIDTDDWPMPDKAAWRAYARLKPQLGVPALYYATHIDSTGEALDADDYALIRETWAAHRATLFNNADGPGEGIVYDETNKALSYKARADEAAGGLSTENARLT